MVGIEPTTLEVVKTLGVMEADGPFEAPSGRKLLGCRDGVVLSTSAEFEFVGIGVVYEFEGNLVYENQRIRNYSRILKALV